MKKNFLDLLDLILILLNYLLYFYLYSIGLSIFSGQQRETLKQMNKYTILLFVLSIIFRVYSLYMKSKSKIFSNILICVTIVLLVVYFYKFYPIIKKIMFMFIPLFVLLFKYLYDINIMPRKKLIE